MPDKKHENENIKTLAQGKTGTEGEFLGPFTPSLPLIEGENEADYQAFREGCLRALNSKDTVEVVWLEDFIYYTWEALRLKKMKAALIEVEKRNAVERLIRIFAQSNMANLASPLSVEWSRGERETVEDVEALFEKHGLSGASVMAMAVEGCLETLERFDKLIAFYDYRRDAANRELEKRRDHLAKRARDFGEAMITDVEPEDMEDTLSALPASLGR